jgi:hypothetical protein
VPPLLPELLPPLPGLLLSGLLLPGAPLPPSAPGMHW